MGDLIHLYDDIGAVVARLLTDKELEGCGLTEENVLRTIYSFKGDEIACSVFLKKYALKDENNQIIEYTLEEAKDRWANAVANAERLFGADDNKVEEMREKFRELYDYFLPAGRQMFALGNDYLKNLTLSNCYVVGIENDSIEGIYECAKKMAKTYAYGGGVGICIGELRPRKAKVSNSARFSTGAVSFMELFSKTTEIIGQSGRRGALMITIPVYHPDIEEFIEIKHNNRDKVKHANISIKLTDEFLQAVQDDKTFLLKFETTHERVEKVVRARVLWEKICRSARDSAEPGLLFWDRSVEMSPSDTYEELKVHTTNPCLSKNNWITTIKGAETVKDLIGKQFTALVDGKPYTSTEEGFYKTGEKEVFLVETYKGFFIEATENHEVAVVRFGRKCWVKVENLEIGDKLVIHNHRRQLNVKKDKDWSEGYILGCLIGDGCFGNKTGILAVYNEKNEKGVVGIEKEVLECVKTSKLNYRSDFKGWRKIKDRDEKRFILREIAVLANKYGITKESKIVTEDIEKASLNFCCGFVRGFFDADGSVQGSIEKGLSVRLAQVNLNNLLIVQRILARLGIISTIYKNRRLEGKRLLPDGKGGSKEYLTQAFHELCISKDNILLYDNYIGFSHKDKSKKLKNFINSYSKGSYKEKFTSKITSIRSLGIKEVYDATIPEINAFDANGCYVHNCSEQNLSKRGDTCNLASVVLSSLVENPFTNQARFNYKKLFEVTQIGVRHLDNIVELNNGRHPLPEQNETTYAGRRIGLGVTGLADVFVALGIKYDSQEALDLTEEIFKTKRDAEYLASIDLAKERGAFPLFNPERHYERGFCVNLPEEIKQLGRKYGQRNVCINTLAPNGSLSIMAQTSSGIEPIFALSYKRYVELGAQRKQFSVNHQALDKYFAVNKREETLPNYWVVAHQINYKSRIKLQGIIQKYCDSAISSTINLPEETTTEEVAQVYMDAWKEGLKGITVYREGSREGILVTDEFAKRADAQTDTIVYRIKAEGGDKFYIPVSYTDGDLTKPYQVFVLNYKQQENDRFTKLAKDIIKMLKENGVDERRIDKYLERSNNSLVKLTRFLSLSLKTNLLEECVEILKDQSYSGTLASELVKIFSKSIVVKNKGCPTCSGSNFRMEEGCAKCLDCGFTACS